MKEHIKTFEEFNESMESMDGTPATTLNTPGMGNVTPPGVGKMGSGDTWGNDEDEDDEDEEKQRRKMRRRNID